MRLVKELHTGSKNQFFKVESLDHPQLMKVFPPSSHGQESARKEWRAAQFLRQHGFQGIPKYTNFSEGSVTMEWLPEIQKVSSSAAYEHLCDFLVWARLLRAPWTVSDDCNDSGDFLKSLSFRLENLQVETPLKQELQAFYEHLSEEREGKFGSFPKRFILSDFHPGQIVSSQGKIFFLDLEDAGMGDPRRFLCNLLLHPQGQVTGVWRRRLLKVLGLSLHEVAPVFPFSYVEWILIFLNGFSKDRKGRETPEERRLRTERAWQWLQRAREWKSQGPSWLEIYLKELN